MDNVNKQKTFVIKFLYFTLILGIIFFILKYALPVFFPFIIAFLISSILRKPTDLISKYLNINRKLVGFILLSILYLSISFIFIFFGTKLFKYVGELFQKLPDIYSTQIEPALNISIQKIKDTIPSLSETLNLENINKYLANIVNSISLSVVNLITSIATKLPSFLIKFIISIIASFFFTLDYYKFTRFIMRQFPIKFQKIILDIKHNIFGTTFKFVKAYSILMVVTFIELSIGFTIFKIPNAIILSVIFSVLDALPVIGVGGILIPWSVIELIKGNYNLSIGFIIIYIIIAIVRSVLEPKVVGKQIGLNPIVTLITMFLGAELFGFLGMFILPIIATIINYLNDSGTVKLFK